MAAYAALTSLMYLIHDIDNHHSPPISLHSHQLQSLTEKVSFLLGFLESYTSPFANVDDEADPLEIRIADAAYAAEDVIESRIVEAIKVDRSNGEKDDSGEKCGEQASSSSLYEDLHQVIEEMDLIKKVATKIKSEKAEVHDQVSASSSSSSSSKHKTTSMVSSDDMLLEVLDQLVAGRPDLQVIPIVGMGGIGKTTLARNIYAHPLIKEYFHICWWRTVSPQYGTSEILRELTYRKGSQAEIDELGLELYKTLDGRRFLIVMDDMWSVDAWDEIKGFFPNNEKGSRILVTTRLSQLSSHLNTDYSLQMKFLDKVSSWNLFSKTVFGKQTCPLELVGIGEEIVDNCRGLPLSIVVVGGLLKKMEHTRGCWESIRNKMCSLVNLEEDKHCLRLLKMCYDHLPVYLKPCFLCMGVFGEHDLAVRVSRVVKLWVCEGFLKPINGESLVTIAKGFFKDLADRNLIQIVIINLGPKYCKIHDLLRDLCLRESQKYGFYNVIGQENPQGIIRQRRVVIPGSISEEKGVDALQCVSGTRSVICHSSNVPLNQKLALLRTLHADEYNTDESYVDALVFQCVNLRHLCIYVGSISSFISSFNLFWNLHTLIADCNYECDAPVGIWKMPQLRHIEFTEEYFFLEYPPPSNEEDGVVVMENFQVLKGVKNFKCGEEVVRRIPNIRKLEILYCDDYDDDDDDDYGLSNIQYLCKLETLHIDCDYFIKGGVIDSSLHKLAFPHSLRRLHLSMDYEFGLEEVLKKIGSLPLLQMLKLVGGCFRSGKWEVDEGQFPSLRYLKLSYCHSLQQWTTQESSIFPRLEQLFLWALKELKEIPRAIGDISTLREIELLWCSESVVMSAKNIVEEQVELQGERLPFHVKVRDHDKNEAVLSFAGPHFEATDP